ncbi:MAG: hypothetical protein JXA44_05375 [Methanospirillaceae archaeon]|nr:hypothetical protein [Methanospirillaceae archaeon]
MVDISIISQTEFVRIWSSSLSRENRLSLVADMCRVNALSSIKKAGSGHLGSSLSSIDIVTMLYYSELKGISHEKNNPDRDIYFSSKGHDVPGYYAVLYSLGLLPKDQFILLRRIKGTCGHPDIGTPCVEANSGSLGMGISKAKGMAFAKRYNNKKGRIFVMLGDGELQEGQNYEALLTAVNQKLSNIIVIIDHNKVQTDKQVCDVSDLGDLELKFQTFGWHTARCNGHNFTDFEGVLRSFDKIIDKPKVIIADTIKGKGISFMEHPAALQAGEGLYRWHSGAPDDTSYQSALSELRQKINNQLAIFGLDSLKLETIAPECKPSASISEEYISDAYGKALLEIARKRKDIIVLDADLAADCHIRTFEQILPSQFIENGIAEQDMVSMAGGLALQGLLPIVHSFAAFLSSRANEQIYNNCCEKTKIIYACHYAGLLPAGPGQSHQSIRDISLFGAMPNMEILQPCNAEETKEIVNYCINQTKNNCMIRLVIGPSPRVINLPSDYSLSKGSGTVINEGSDAIIFAYGPVMLHESLIAAELLAKKDLSLKVVNMPWLNVVNQSWLQSVIGEIKNIFILEDHVLFGGLFDTLMYHLIKIPAFYGRNVELLGIIGLPAWGRPWEVLQYHGLNGNSIADKILTKSDGNNEDT